MSIKIIYKKYLFVKEILSLALFVKLYNKKYQSHTFYHIFGKV